MRGRLIADPATIATASARSSPVITLSQASYGTLRSGSAPASTATADLPVHSPGVDALRITRHTEPFLGGQFIQATATVSRTLTTAIFPRDICALMEVAVAVEGDKYELVGGARTGFRK